MELEKLEFLNELRINNKEDKVNINKNTLRPFIENIRNLLLLDYLSPQFSDEDYLKLYHMVEWDLENIFTLTNSENPKEETKEYLSDLKKIRRLLLGSAQAIYDGDPAANSIQEIILAYPGFQAIGYYCIAHAFYLRKKFFLARFISEEAHQLYGIDINPGATIGENFFIDHGTGIVIGETTVIGNNVKLYQGVTLGALSLKEGHALKGNKRHPTVEDNVTIYSNASIFGGNTIIGESSVIGANTFLVSSVPPKTIIYLNREGMTVAKK